MSIISSLKSGVSKVVNSLTNKKTPAKTSTLVIPKTTPAPMSVAPKASTVTPKKATTIAGAVGLSGLASGGVNSSYVQPVAPFKAPVVPQVKTTTPAPVYTASPTNTSTPTVPRETSSSSSRSSSSNRPAVPDTREEEKQKKEKPPVPSVTEKAVADAEKAYVKSMEISNDELATQADLDRLSESAQKAYTGTKDKAIPMEFITGQLASIEERALNLAEPLEAKLARLEAKRTNAVEMSKFALERADAQAKTAADATKPISIGGSLVQRNAAGGYDTVYSEPTADKLLSPTEAASLGVPYGTTQSQAFGKTPASSDGLTPYQQFQATQAIQKTTQTNTSAARELARQGSVLTDTWERFKNGEAGDLNATTQAIVTTFNKILDPTSVVRETEYDRSSAGQSLLASIEGKIAKISQGGPGLTPESLQELVDLGTTYTRNAQASIAAENARAREQAIYFGLNPDFVTTSGSSQAQSLDQFYKENPDIRPKVDQLIMENPDLSDEDILQIVGGGSFSSGGAGNTNRPQRNNNPLNIKASENTISYSGVKGTDPNPASDGGQFLVFESPQAGFDAAKRLLKTDGYINLTVDGAMKRWSNSGYGGEVAPSLKSRPISSLSDAELQQLLDAMATREGYYA